MNKQLLQKHIKSFVKKYKDATPEALADREERADRVKYYQKWTKDRLLKMTEDDILEYIAKLWAMLIWGNKQYAVDKIITDNGLDNFRKHLADLVWGSDSLDKRWDRFRKEIKGTGPATASEILCHTHPKECAIWNRRVYVGLRHLEVPDLPRHDYQLTGKVYLRIIDVMGNLMEELRHAGLKDANLLTVDYFIWDELRVEENLSQIFAKPTEISKPAPEEVKTFLHNEVRDKLAEIGEWLGFQTYTERKVAEGSQVDTVWEATIGNMGRVIYVFEVQTRGSIDSLILNLLKALNNPAVQGVVAVSDAEQLDRIRKHAADVGDLHKKLRYWDYQEVLQIHESLEEVNRVINSLGLVPEGF